MTDIVYEYWFVSSIYVAYGPGGYRLNEPPAYVNTVLAGIHPLDWLVEVKKYNLKEIYLKYDVSIVNYHVIYAAQFERSKSHVNYLDRRT